jgi:hypothetical protein
MDKRIIKFIIISVLFIIAAYWAALKFSMFATGLVAFIPVCYFLAKGVKSLWQLVKGREIRTNLIIVLVSIIGFVFMIHALKFSDHGLQDLTKHRMQALNQLRPILLKYKEERGCYPNKLHDLVPDYLQVVPPELLNGEKEDWYKNIIYEVVKGEASFIFFRIRGPDSRVTYHVSENRYEYDQ